MKQVFQISLMLFFAMFFTQTSFAQTWQAQPDARPQDKKEATDRPTKPKTGNGSGTHTPPKPHGSSNNQHSQKKTNQPEHGYRILH